MPEVLDISSDEEEGLDESLTVTDFNWIREMLFPSDEESDDSVEVVEIRRSKPQLKSKSSALAVKDVGDDDDDEDDDDCVVLEGDPEKGVPSVEDEENGSDELLVIGEKGQIACRDYPHARHNCVKFPFSSSPHEKHCSLCHCFVCDSLAPCPKWGTGISSSDHCHANNTEFWKIQRKNFKLGQSSPLPAVINFGTSLGAGHPQCNEFLPLGINNLSPNSVLQNQAAMCTVPSQTQASQPPVTRFLSAPSPNSTLQNQVSMPINAPIKSPATNFTMPNGANTDRCWESRRTLVRTRCQPHSVPVRRPVLGVRSHNIQRDRGNVASRVLRPHMMTRSVNSGNTLMANNSPHGSSGFDNYVNMTQQHQNYNTVTGLPNYKNCNGPYDICHPTNISVYSQLSSQPGNLSCVNQHTVASETQTYGQPLSQSNNNQGFHQTCIQVSGGPSSHTARLNSSQHGNEPQIRSQNGNASRDTTTCGTAGQDTCQSQLQPPHEESQRETVSKFSAFDSSWTNNTGQSILQTSGSVGQSPNVNESSAQFTVSNESLFECSQLPSSLVDFNSWLLEKDPLPMLTDGFLPSELNIPSPDFYPADMGMGLFYLDGK
ncbi:hypothetical protein VNO78_21900 [Psophocarpus tetragonolobus]|uniref:Uncharacterized protein n=1 Tax=Psophocarpus tetragonolobus TaxID=3891 RepID=A0AAN9SCD2_PSOTE